MVNKRYHKLAFKSLLSVTYFFLFAVQFTGKFYTIANFFVYNGSNGQHASAANPSGNIPPDCQSFVHTKSLPDGLHLSLDKRYHAGHLELASFGQPGLTQVYTEVRKKCYPTFSFCVSPNLTNASLRGPPDA
jgi:hypothetical protein